MALSFRRMRLLLPSRRCSLSSRARRNPQPSSGHVTGEGGIALSRCRRVDPRAWAGRITRDDGSFAVAVPSARVNRQAVTVTARRVGYKPKTRASPINPGLSRRTSCSKPTRFSSARSS